MSIFGYLHRSSAVTYKLTSFMRNNYVMNPYYVNSLHSAKIIYLCLMLILIEYLLRWFIAATNNKGFCIIHILVSVLIPSHDFERMKD